MDNVYLLMCGTVGGSTVVLGAFATLCTAIEDAANIIEKLSTRGERYELTATSSVSQPEWRAGDSYITVVPYAVR